MQNKMNFITNPMSRGEYEYDINIPSRRPNNIADSVGSNSGSVAGNYSDNKQVDGVMSTQQLERYNKDCY